MIYKLFIQEIYIKSSDFYTQEVGFYLSLEDVKVAIDRITNEMDLTTITNIFCENINSNQEYSIYDGITFFDINGNVIYDSIYSLQCLGINNKFNINEKVYYIPKISEGKIEKVIIKGILLCSSNQAII